MGAFGESKLLGHYSDWHWQHCGSGPQAYMTDLDMTLVNEGEDVRQLWVEADAVGAVAVIDIKEPKAEITFVQIQVYNDIVNNWKKPVYIVYPSYPDGFTKTGKIVHFESFRVIRWKDKHEKTMTESQYIEWIRSLRDRAL